MKKHGLSRTPDGRMRAEYTAWVAMIQRCHNPANPGFRNYGARGIVVCQEWRDSFKCFYRDMGDKPSSEHSIDRIDNDGNYEPANCRWTTRTEQARNTTRNALLDWNGRSMTAAEWADLGPAYGQVRRVVLNRIYHGWSVEDALTWPAGRRQRSKRHDGLPSQKARK